MSESWLPVAEDSHFSLANVPLGIVSTQWDSTPRVATRVGDIVLDLAAFSEGDGFSGLPSMQPHLEVFQNKSLNAFAALGRPLHKEVRAYLQSILALDTKSPQLLKDNSAMRQKVMLPLASVNTHMPMEVGDYTDFYAGLNHAYNVGVLFRGPDNALQPNYKHLPVGYHGRASSVVVSGTSLKRPWGQILENPTQEPKIPTFTPCRRLDIELELGAFVCKANPLGTPVSVAEAEQSIFGLVLMNDWSARDVQAWEYVPLGPFNSKNFGTSISAWVVLADALQPFVTSGLERGIETVSYLEEEGGTKVYDIKLQVHLKPGGGQSTKIVETNGRNLIWSFAQMLAHHTVTGCGMRVGDLLGSGTISGTANGSQGSLLEQNQGGKAAISLSGGVERKFLEDNDTVTITGYCGKAGALVGFGECTGTILPAVKR